MLILVTEDLLFMKILECEEFERFGHWNHSEGVSYSDEIEGMRFEHTILTTNGEKWGRECAKFDYSVVGINSLQQQSDERYMGGLGLL